MVSKSIIRELEQLHQQIKREYLMNFGENGIGSKNNPITLNWLKNQRGENFKRIRTILNQIKRFIRQSNDIQNNYKILREIYAISPSFHENWFYEDHLIRNFEAISKKRSGLKAYLTSKQKGTLEKTLQGITTTVFKYTLLLENLTCSKLSNSLMNKSISLSDDVKRDIKNILNITENAVLTSDIIVKSMPCLFRIVRYLLELSGYKQLKSDVLLKSWLLYAPCSINEGPIFKSKTNYSLLDVLKLIPELKGSEIRKHLKKYYDVEEILHV